MRGKCEGKMSSWLGHGLECGSSSYRLLMFSTLGVREPSRYLFYTLRCRTRWKGGSCCYRTPRPSAHVFSWQSLVPPAERIGEPRTKGDARVRPGVGRHRTR